MSDETYGFFQGITYATILLEINTWWVMILLGVLAFLALAIVKGGADACRDAWRYYHPKE